jgi:putative hydrolase of the HAD superfamily
VKLLLVTSGFRTLQESKIEALGLRSRFDAVHVDAIDEADRKGKDGIFRDILERYGFEPERVLVVGDNPESEIEAGNRLGMATVQILRPGVARGATATHYIHGLSELRAIIEAS